MIALTPKQVRGDCVDSVVLEPKINSESKTIAWITARDKASGHVLHSQALVGVIDKLAISIRFHYLYTGDYKYIEVVAYDDDGDIFSDLDGFRFDWSIVSGHEFIKITDKPEGIRHHRESQSDVAFLKGLAAGPAEISVRIKEPGYDYIKTVSVKIQVVDPFVLEPHREVYILPTSAYYYKLHKLVRDKDGAINQETQSLPNSRYTLGVANKTLGSVEQSGRYISDVHEGVQHITAVDQKMTNNTAEAWLNVVHPYRLTVSIHDVTNSNLPSKDNQNLA